MFVWSRESGEIELSGRLTLTVLTSSTKRPLKYNSTHANNTTKRSKRRFKLNMLYWLVCAFQCRFIATSIINGDICTKSSLIIISKTCTQMT